MAFKMFAIILLVTLFQVQTIQSWPQNPWIQVSQALSQARQQTSIAINALQRQVSFEINAVMIPLSITLNRIQDQARLQESECSDKVLADIASFFATEQWLYTCRNDAELNILRVQQMQKIDALYNKLAIGQSSCTDQACIDQTSQDIKAAAAQITEQTNAEISKFSEVAGECIQERGDDAVKQANDIEESWKLC